MSSAPAIFTREALLKSLQAKTGYVLDDDATAARLASNITAAGLTEVIAGRHDGKAVTFARGFELVFGERLTASRDGRR